MSEDPGAADTSTHERAAEDAERESERPKRPSVTEEASTAAGKEMRRFEEGPNRPSWVGDRYG